MIDVFPCFGLCTEHPCPVRQAVCIPGIHTSVRFTRRHFHLAECIFTDIASLLRVFAVNDLPVDRRFDDKNRPGLDWEKFRKGIAEPREVPAYQFLVVGIRCKIDPDRIPSIPIALRPAGVIGIRCKIGVIALEVVLPCVVDIDGRTSGIAVVGRFGRSIDAVWYRTPSFDP